MTSLKSPDCLLNLTMELEEIRTTRLATLMSPPTDCLEPISSLGLRLS